ncbi:MAG: hypothetical protein M3Q49_00040 [Actinomycetota bacterium]|nr:hypothetical protein [Actinomycetota bacterium]
MDHITALLYDLTHDFHSWIAPYRIDGEPDKYTKGRIIIDKLNLLRGYERRYSTRLDNRSKVALDSVIEQFGRRSSVFFNALPGYFGGSFGDPYQLPEDPNLAKVRVTTEKWLAEDLPKALGDLEEEFTQSLKISPSWWRRR